jgi:hypothetical protein
MNNYDGIVPLLLPRLWLRAGSAHFYQFQVGNALKVSPVPREQGHTVSESDTSDEAVGHSDCLAFPVKLTTNFGSVPRGVAVERQHRERMKQLANGTTPPAFVSAAEKLETGNSRGLELFGLDVLLNLILHRLDANQKVDQHIGIG